MTDSERAIDVISGQMFVLRETLQALLTLSPNAEFVIQLSLANSKNRRDALLKTAVSEQFLRGLDLEVEFLQLYETKLKVFRQKQDAPDSRES